MKKKTFVQFVKFCLVGISNTLVSYFLNVGVLIILKPLSMKRDYMVANIVAFLLSVLWSFFLNNRFVFGISHLDKRKQLEILIKTYLSYSFSCIILAIFLSWFWIEMLDISKYIAPILNSIVTVPVNFLLNKFWAFNKKE